MARSPSEGPRAADSPAAACLVQAVAERGFGVDLHFLDPGRVADLRGSLLARRERGAFRRAAVGAGAARRIDFKLRGDLISWLDVPETPAERAVFSRLEHLRLALNRELGLGLFELEAHYAIYPAGACYTRHLDRSPAGRERVLSFALYLNVGWRAADGGALRLYSRPPCSLPPRPGTLALFLSERFEHEVAVTRRERLSLSGWFSRRAAAGVAP